ncbi:hypothetical protein ACRAWF_05995 [Streptomyces sp. L7]
MGGEHRRHHVGDRCAPPGRGVQELPFETAALARAQVIFTVIARR